MICKLLSIPVRAVSTIIGFVIGIFKVIISLGFGTFRLIFNRLFGTIFGALIGLLMGRKHIGVKLFTGKKRNKCKK